MLSHSPLFDDHVSAIDSHRSGMMRRGSAGGDGIITDARMEVAEPRGAAEAAASMMASIYKMSMMVGRLDDIPIAFIRFIPCGTPQGCRVL